MKSVVSDCNAKVAKNYAEGEIPKFIHKSILFKGKPKNTTRGNQNEMKWKYLNENELEKLFGFSLKYLIPQNNKK